MDVFFPVKYNVDGHDGFSGPAVDLNDAGAIYIMNCDEFGSGGVVAKTSLREMVEIFIDGSLNIHSGVIDGEFLPAARALAVSLRQAADALDAAQTPSAAPAHPVSSHSPDCCRSNTPQPQQTPRAPAR